MFLLPIVNTVAQQHPSPGVTVGETAATILILRGHIWEQICPILNNNKIGTKSSNSVKERKGERETERGKRFIMPEKRLEETLHKRSYMDGKKIKRCLPSLVIRER